MSYIDDWTEDDDGEPMGNWAEIVLLIGVLALLILSVWAVVFRD